ncbi:hypothetical protein BKA57DRAFT_96300 [Linnemannia elongata]|nr:hypothetical protein BKA57DRAFT_96300 [Linnemannia elongata]
MRSYAPLAHLCLTNITSLCLGFHFFYPLSCHVSPFSWISVSSFFFLFPLPFSLPCLSRTPTIVFCPTLNIYFSFERRVVSFFGPASVVLPLFVFFFLFLAMETHSPGFSLLSRFWHPRLSPNHLLIIGVARLKDRTKKKKKKKYERRFT